MRGVRLFSRFSPGHLQKVRSPVLSTPSRFFSDGLPRNEGSPRNLEYFPAEENDAVSLKWPETLFKRITFGLWHMGFYAENELIGHPELVSLMRAESEKVFARRKKLTKEIHPSDWNKAPQTLCFVKSLLVQIGEQLSTLLPELDLNREQYVSKWYLGTDPKRPGDFMVDNGGDLKDLRKLTIVYFMNPEYGKVQHGGQWELATEQIEENGKKTVHSSLIKPENDRLLVFWSDSVPHRIMPGKETCYMELSLFTKNPKLIGTNINPEFNGFLTPLRSDLKVEYFKNLSNKLQDPRK